MSSEDPTQLTVEEKATLSEVMKEAQATLKTNNDGSNEFPTAMVGGAMMNSQPRPLMLTKTLGGGFIMAPPKNLGGDNDIGTFLQRAPTSPHVPVDGGPGPGPVMIIGGCEGAVIYVTYDNDLLQLGYLLAWVKSLSSTEHKVYVEAGNPSKFIDMTLEDIKKKMHASTSHYLDGRTGAYAYAEIELLEDETAVLSAIFDQKLIGENTSES